MAHTQYNVPGQTNLATVNTFFLGKPAPIVAERIWDTKAHAQSYIDDTVGSALAGIILRVTDDTTNNGAYLVEKDITATNGLKLSKFLTGTDTNTWRNIKVKTSASGTATEILSTSSTLPLTLTADSNITLTAVQDTNNEYTGEIKISASGGGNDTWRNIYVNGGNSETIGTGTDTKAINYTAGDGITISYLAAGTGTGQSGNANYFNIKTTLNTAGNNTLGGIKLGYTQSGRNMPLQTDSDKAYVNTHTTNTNTVYLAGTNVTLSTPTTTDYTLTSTDVYNDTDSSMFKVQLTPTVTRFNNDTIIKVRFPSNVISSKRLVFYTGRNARNNLVSCYNNDMYSTSTKWFYPSSNILHSDMYYYFIRKSTPNGFIYLGTNVESIAASGGGSANDSTITLRGGNSTTHSTWSDNFTTNASSDKTIYVPVMTGATSGANGEMGLVPTPASADREKYLRGDGTWQTVSGGSTDSFKTIAVSGQSSVVADSSTDTLTLVAGTGMTITTNANTDTITFASSGGGGGVEHMGVYYFVDTNVNNIYRPFEALCDLFSNIFNDGKTNDIHAYVDAVIREYPGAGGNDGHIPLGAVILLYGMYLIQINSSTGRFIYESNGLGDYCNYIIADKETPEMWGDSGCTTYDLLTTCNIFLVTANWTGALPLDINEYNAGTAGQCGTYTASGGSVTIPSVGRNANSPIWHKYTFDFANVAQGDLYSDPTTLSTINSFISAIKSGDGQQAETIFAEYFKEKPDMSFFNNKITEGSVPGMLVTVHHESSVAYYAHEW